MGLPSRPREFHPEPLTEPDVNLSIHPARAIEIRHIALTPMVLLSPLKRQRLLSKLCVSPAGSYLLRGVGKYGGLYDR